MKLFTDGRFYKGNLHTHTTLSDGRKTPEEAVALYKEHGYDFIAITDHRKRYPTVENDDFIVLAGGEYHHQPGVTAYHIVGIGMTEDVHSDDKDSPQGIIDKIRAAGGMPILAHPAWSLMTATDGLALHGYEAVEIFNGISDGYAHRGYSDLFCDICAIHGRLTGLIADDDAHFYVGHDALMGYICLQAESFTEKGLMDALWAGHYYASTGAELKQVTIEDGIVRCECGPCTEVYFMTNTWVDLKRTVRPTEGKTLTSAEYTLKPRDRWVRVEGLDENGGRFWSNYIKIKD